MQPRTVVLSSLALASIVGASFAAGWFARGARERAEASARSARRPPPQRPLVRPALPPRPGEPALDAPPAPAPPREFRIDRGHTGRSGYALPLDFEVVHRVRTGGRISTQPVLNAMGRVVVGSHDGHLYSVDVDRGAVLWRLNTGDRIYTTALVAPDATIYAGTDADRLFSVDTRGRLRWALGTEADADTSPARAEDGSLRFAAGRVLYATSADLTIRWRLQFGSKLFSSPLVLEDGTTVIGCQDDRLYAVDAGGVVRWQLETEGDVDAPPAVYDGVVYVGSDDGHVYAANVADGSRRWRTSVGGYVRAGVAIGLDGRVVVGTYGPSPRIVALDRHTGAIVWSVAVPGGPPTAEWGVASSALVDRDGRFAIGIPNGQLWVLERDGTVLERVQLGGVAVDGSPALLRDGLLAVGDDDGTLWILGARPAIDGGDAGDASADGERRASDEHLDAPREDAANERSLRR
jgi:outer membrane protein assembly factor BamB